MRALSIAIKDLLQIIKDWKSGLFLLAMPLAFTVFFGVVVNFPGRDPRLLVGFVDEDGGSALSLMVRETLAGSADIRLADVDKTTGEKDVRDGRRDALVIVPRGYQADALAGTSPRLDVVADASSPVGREAGEVVRVAAGRILGSVQAALMSQEPARDSAALLAATRRALDEWKSPAVRVTTQTAGGTDGEVRTSTGFLQSSPGMLVQFAIYGLITSAMLLVTERRSRALSRMLSMPVSARSIVGGHVAAMFFVALLQQLILIACGQLLFGVDYLQAPLASLVMIVSLALWASCLGLLIGALAKKEEHVIIFVMAAMFLLSALGGAWFPLEVAGAAFARVGHVLPTAWAMDGFQNIVLRGLGLASVLLPAGILLGYAVVFFGLAVWRFRFE